MEPHWTRTLDILADAINPALILAVIVAPLIVRRRDNISPSRESLPWNFWARAAFSIALVYGFAQLDRQLHIWPNFGLDYSTHSAIALAAAISLAFYNRRWLVYLIPLLLFYGALMWALKFHTVADMLTTAILIVPLVFAVHWVGSTAARSSTPVRSSTLADETKTEIEV